jgi:hypothetical protein
MKRIFFLLSLTLLTLIAANAQDSTAKKQYVGKYKFPEGSIVPEVVVVMDNGALMMNSSAGTSSLEQIKADTFSIVSFNGTAVFIRNNTKKVIGVHIDASGYVLDGVKDSTAIIDVSYYKPGINSQLQSVFAPAYVSANSLEKEKIKNYIIVRECMFTVPGSKPYRLNKNVIF